MDTHVPSLKYKLHLGRRHILTVELSSFYAAYKVAPREKVVPAVSVRGWGRPRACGSRDSRCAEAPAARSPPSGTSEERAVSGGCRPVGISPEPGLDCCPSKQRWLASQ